jgi:hypothetical protein
MNRTTPPRAACLVSNRPGPLPGEVFTSLLAVVAWAVTTYEAEGVAGVELGAGREGVLVDLGIALLCDAGDELCLTSSR